MADIELVIKIDEEYIEQIDKLKFSIGGIEDKSLQINVINAIKNGTPLPKGHGAIVDIETLIDMFWDGNSMEITKYDLSVIDPIIEADKAESEDDV